LSAGYATNSKSGRARTTSDHRKEMLAEIERRTIFEVWSYNLNANRESVTYTTDGNNGDWQIACACRSHPRGKIPVGPLLAAHHCGAARHRLRMIVRNSGAGHDGK